MTVQDTEWNVPVPCNAAAAYSGADLGTGQIVYAFRYSTAPGSLTPGPC